MFYDLTQSVLEEFVAVQGPFADLHDRLSGYKFFRITLNDRRGKPKRPCRDQHGTAYTSQADAARRTGCTQAMVWKVLTGRQRQSRGYRFTYGGSDERLA